MDFNFVTPGITVFIYFIAEILKKLVLKTNHQKRWLPFICAMIGIVMAITIYFVYPKGSMATNVIEAFATGALSGFAATGFNQLFKQFSRYSAAAVFPEDMQQPCHPGMPCNTHTHMNNNPDVIGNTINNNTTINNTTITYGNEDEPQEDTINTEEPKEEEPQE